MEVFVTAWIIFGIITGVIANAKGKNGVAWGIYGFLLAIVAIPHVLIAKPNQDVLDQRAVAKGTMKKCPNCAELVKGEARTCRHCGHPFQEASRA